MKIIKPIIIFLTFCLLAHYSFAQQKGFKDLQVFLQTNTDSIIIFEHTSNWMHPPKYWIISKKKDTITLYKYAETFEPNILMPQKIRDELMKIHYRKNRFDVGINSYFNAKYLEPRELKELWVSLSNQNPWQLKDDKIEGSGCPIDQNPKGQNVYDGGGMDLYLITKNEIKKLSFYAPDFYQKICPGKTGRTGILKIETLFSKAFKENQD